jgi:DNA-nicking Smr family endonuclease
MRRRTVDETELWRRAMRDVAPLPGRSADPDRGRLARNAAATEAVQARAGPSPSPRQPAPQPLPPLDRFAGVDRATAERLKRGRYPVEACLDLHGMTQERAHRALADLVAASRAAGQRCLLVITGHGRMGGGVLKAAVPRWLDEPDLRRHVLAIAPTQPKDGGGGALYVLLRRLPQAGA